MLKIQEYESWSTSTGQIIFRFLAEIRFLRPYFVIPVIHLNPRRYLKAFIRGVGGYSSCQSNELVATFVIVTFSVIAIIGPPMV